MIIIVRKQSVLVVGQFGLLPRRSDLLLGPSLSLGTHPDLSHPKTHLLDNDKKQWQGNDKDNDTPFTYLCICVFCTLDFLYFCTFVLLYFYTFVLLYLLSNSKQDNNPKER